jgi:hypothetical protein
VKRWGQKANNRGEWASVVKEPRFLENHRIKDYIYNARSNFKLPDAVTERN